jgi:hypothetical protein
MENIFKKNIIPYNYFNLSIIIKYDLYDYLYDNLQNEQKNTLKFDLRNALKTNANGKYF